MSLLRAAALLGRAGLAAGPGLPAQLGALSALQHKLTGCLNQQHPAAWLQARGMSAPGGGGSSGGGSGADQQQQQQPASQEHKPAAAAIRSDEKEPEQPEQQGTAAQQPDTPQPTADGRQAAQAAEPAGKDAAAAGRGGASSDEQPSSSQSIEQDPRLAKFVEGLKQLKGAARGVWQLSRTCSESQLLGLLHETRPQLLPCLLWIRCLLLTVTFRCCLTPAAAASRDALAGSSTVQRQTVGGDTPWWLTMLSNWVGPIVQNWIA